MAHNLTPCRDLTMFVSMQLQRCQAFKCFKSSKITFFSLIFTVHNVWNETKSLNPLVYIVYRNNCCLITLYVKFNKREIDN